MGVVRVVPVLYLGVLGDRLDSLIHTDELPKGSAIWLNDGSSKLIDVTPYADAIVYEVFIDYLKGVAIVLLNADFFEFSNSVVEEWAVRC